MKRTNRSIRRQLLIWVMSPILGIIILSIVSSYYLATHFANTAFDTELEENAKGLAGHVIFNNNQWTLASPELSQQAYSFHAQDKIYFLMTRPQGEIIGGDRRLGLPIQSASYPAFTDKVIQGEPVRVVTLKIPLKHDRHQSFMWIQMAETLNERSILARQILTMTIAHQLALALLATLLVGVGVTNGLIPLERLRQALEKRTPDELKPIDDGDTPTEVRPLTATINGLMKRIADHIESQKRFIANSAHQLRTPLAGLQTQLELALRQTDPALQYHALQQMQISLERIIHLTHQLLSLAKADPHRLGISALQPVNLTQLAKQGIEDFLSRAHQKAIDLGFEGLDTSVMIQGVEESLREMLSNLLDNAVLYTPHGGRVTVKVMSGDGVTLCVEDSGPGIPVDERSKVFERFYRLNTANVPGSGLGLAIVQDIVKAHRADIAIQSGCEGTGTLVSIHFP